MAWFYPFWFFTKFQVISGAGHHVYADKSETFNRHVLEACQYSDSIAIPASSSSFRLAIKADSDEPEKNEDNEVELKSIEPKRLENSRPRSS